MSEKSTTYISSGLLILFALALWIATADFPTQSGGYPGPSLFPRIISIGLMISGLTLLFLSRKEEESNEPSLSAPASWQNLAGGIGLGMLFPFFAPYLGLSLGAGIVCLGIGLLFRLRWVLAITISIGATLFLYLIFTLGLGITV
ncbi:MAG: tripartite tricarboxylate transporter TctB family protein [Bacteroidota bacterium]